MKIVYALTLFCVAFFTSVQGRCQGKLISVRIEFEGFNTETISNVSCDRFRQLFKESLDKRTISNRPGVNHFKTLSMHFLEQKLPVNVDIRGIVTFYYQHENIEYCFDTFGRFYRAGKAYSNKMLLIHIADLLYSSHPQYLDTLRTNFDNLILIKYEKPHAPHQ